MIRLEGEITQTRKVVLEFPSKADAEAWYHSEEYGDIRSIRQSASSCNVYMIEGFVE